jgi:hypothetical protein
MKPTTDLSGIKYIEVSKAPSISWLLDNTGRAYHELASLTDDLFIKTWKAVNIANYLWRNNIEPSGFVWSRHKHLPHQMGAQLLLDKTNVEFVRRGMNKTIGIDICFANTEKLSQRA